MSTAMASMVSERVAVTVAAASTCGCGQALETCHSGHCPRCGVTLHLPDRA